MSELRQSAVRGMKWSVAGRLAKSGMSFVTLAIISRFLTPAEFGAVALVMFVTGFMQLFVDAGLRTALVQRAEISELQKNTVFWTSIALSALIAAVTLIFAGPVAKAFDAEAITSLIRWTTLIFPLVALQCVSMTLLERQFRFNRIATADVSAALIGSLMAIVLVFMGFGMGALIAQQVVQALLSTVLIICSARWMPRLQFNWSEFFSLTSYGGYVMLTNLVNFLTVQLSRPIVAGVISAEVLGYFTMAQVVLVSPFRVVVQMARKVLFPILASVQNDRARVGAAYLKVQFAISAVMSPACLGVAAIAYPFVDFALADGWGAVAPLIQLVALQMLLSPVQETNQTVLASLGYARFQFLWGLIMGGISVLAMWYAARWGIEAALWARIGLTFVTVPVLSIYTTRLVNLPLHALPLALAGPMIASCSMFAAVYFALEALSLPSLVEIVLGVVMGAAIYPALLFLISRERSMDLIGTFRQKREAPTI